MNDDAARQVAHVFGILDRGGAETVTLDLCRQVPRGEFREVFITLGGREGKLASEFRLAGAEVRQCPLHPVPTFVWRLWRCLREIRPKIVVSHVGLGSGAVLPVARLARVKIRVARMWSSGDGRPDTFGRRMLRTVLRWLIRHSATDVLGVTAAALEFARPHGDSRYRVLYNSVDPQRAAGWSRDAARRHWELPEHALVIAHLGRAAAVKNRAFLIDVLDALRRRVADVNLILAGPGGIDDLIATHSDLTSDPQIILAGEVDEIGSVLAAADVFLLPSWREGLPGVVLEALSVGTPVVASDLACLREVQKHVHGLTVLPIAAGAECWADLTVEAATADASTRQEIGRSLTSSPFMHSAALQGWLALWRR